MSVFTGFFAELSTLLEQHSKTIGAQPSSSTSLGEDRELFLHTVLMRSLPVSIRTDRGVIVFSKAPSSNPQDILL